MYASHANVQHAQTISNEKQVLQIKHFATCASHLIPSGRSAYEGRAHHQGDCMRQQQEPKYQ